MKNITLILTLILFGCTVGPDYVRPSIQPPESFVSQDVLKSLNDGKDEQDISPDWWTGFEDETLNKLVEEGIANNFEIKAAYARVTQEKARIALADSGDSLSLDADIDGNIDERSSIKRGTNSTTKSIAAGLAATLPLDIFGRTKRNVEMSVAGYQRARQELKGVVLGISSDIVSEYMTLRGTQQQLELLKESVKLQEKTLSIVRSRLKSGISPELDLQRAITSVENLRAGIPSLERDLQNSRNNLAILTGNFPGVYEDMLKVTGDIPKYNSLIPDLMPLAVLETRPDVRAAEESLKETVAGIGVAQVAFYPEFELTGAISIGLTGISGSPTTSTLISSLGSVIDRHIYDGGSTQASFAIAKAQSEEALADYEQILREATKEVEEILAAIKASKLRQESLKKSVTSSRRSFNQAETLYQEGLISFLDVVDAQRVFADARQNLASEQTNYSVNVSRLFEALGVDIKYDKTQEEKK
ncbi:MAG: efflux transporter outer membrane subunit [Rickettsiales bacterium]|nr:efflux transporter outer membrane subunit [Pseudomonadota bacterium]MDA0967393.1 efflux transporter outer membrane subunit [Pseudomonadota bacterium]MDG4544416.1 efflux transporter outer membrane subunit [Rickettsiales bacterium]MDG4546546.1 efflux transporter outer membrane subunit [Rickettsiales bacterium]MDG4548692.1 efflux transporter outer membrane subunit [Rickettsiales bacterium]